MKYLLLLISFFWLQQSFGQNQPHYTMFMYNKLIYNPGYAGSRDLLSINATYRNQWTGVEGAPVTMNISADAPIGGYASPFKKVALGISVNGEKAGPTTNNTISAYYAYRVPLKKSIVSFGLQAGASIYSARYSELKIYDPTDQVLLNDISGKILPNVGAGIYWYSDHGYMGLSVPSLLENYYDKSQKNYANGKTAKQIRSYYANAGYSLKVDENFSLLPQVLVRYYKDADYSLPVSADFNLSAIIYKRVMVGITVRTDRSIESIIHLQVLQRLNIGYSYDLLMSDYASYAKSTHEVVLGFDFIKDRKQYQDPRFIKNF